MSDNDFTLQELKLIQDNLGWNDCPYLNLELSELRYKVGQMIENYCDHDFQNTYNEREVWECSKCGIE